ncbi:hypothetical protein ASF71_18440 [Deinococcus sp. Leaf326]|nr:hypothetical protein ASF71_18440 [Deinococcus sp. Leaf326]
MFRTALWLAGAALTALLSGCMSTPTAQAPAPALRSVGLVELSISGLSQGQQGLTQPVARMTSMSTRSGLQALALADQADSIQFDPLSVSVFNTGTRGAGGARYVTATFRVRNADQQNTPVARDRKNVTLLAVPVADSLGTTAFRAVTTFGGSPVAAGVARTMTPSHAMRYDPLSAQPVLSPGGEDLQVFSENDVLPANFSRNGAPTTYQALGVTTVLPYGFTVHTPAGGRTLPASPAAGVYSGRVTLSVLPYGFTVHTPAGGRTLPASPAAGVYSGRVTLSVKLPLQATPAADPWAFRMSFLVIEDSVTAVTQSLEEQALGNTGVSTRASAVGATVLNVLPGTTLTAGPAGTTLRRICQVRTAGAAGEAGAAYLVNTCP